MWRRRAISGNTPPLRRRWTGPSGGPPGPGPAAPGGGAKETILAAKRAGITELILSEENRKESAEIKPEYIEGLTFHYVRTNDEVLKLALE